MTFQNDAYKKIRGGYSRLYEITCRKCGEVICNYQKDGPGNLRRLYIDRMSTENKKKELICSKGHILGIKILHTEHDESRLAYRLFVDSIERRVIKSVQAPILSK